MSHLYSNEHLHGASLVWIERREAIKARLIKEHPHLDPIDIESIVGGCALYSSCHEELFQKVTAEVAA